MADILTSSELDSMKKSLEFMTDLSKQLRSVFTQIKTETDLTGTGFTNIVSAAKTNSNIAEKYLIAQKTSNLLSEKINELKSKVDILTVLVYSLNNRNLYYKKK